MAFKLLSRTREQTTTTGTGDITVSGLIAASNRKFSDGLAVGDTTYVCILSGDGTGWEECFVTYTALNTLQRGAIVANSAGDTVTHVSLTGTSRVFAVIPSDFVALFNQLGGGDITEFLRADGVFAAPYIWGWHYPASFATTTALAANTYNNGTAGVGATLTKSSNGALGNIDGITPVVGYRLLVKDEATASHNGIYTVTQIGDASHPYILTRVTDFNSDSNINQGDVVVVGPNGTANAARFFQVTASASPIVLGTTGFTFNSVAVPVMVGDTGSGGAAGLVPAPASGDAAAGKFLKANGTWAAPSGGGGGGGLVAPGISATLPTAANTGLSTWVSQGASTVADTAAGIYLRNSGSGSFSVSMRTKTVPATPYTMKFGTIISTQNSAAYGGVGYYDGTNKLHLMGLLNNAILIGQANSPTSYSSNDINATCFVTPYIFWELSDDGTTITWAYSLDGVNFETLHTTTKSTGFLGATGYANIGIFIDPTSANVATGLTLFSFS